MVLNSTLVWWLVGILFMTVGCKHAPQPTDDFGALFAGYSLIRAGVISPDDSMRDGGLGQLPKAVPGSVTLTRGYAYGFRKTNDWPNETIALRILPDRLKSIGARIISAPKSESELIFAVIGGPFFTIEFEKHGHRGTIFNRLVADEREGEKGEEVLIAIFR